MPKYTVTLDGDCAGIAEFDVTARSMQDAIAKIKPTTDWTITCVSTQSGRKLRCREKGTKTFSDVPASA